MSLLQQRHRVGDETGPAQGKQQWAEAGHVSAKRCDPNPYPPPPLPQATVYEGRWQSARQRRYKEPINKALHEARGEFPLPPHLPTQHTHTHTLPFLRLITGVVMAASCFPQERGCVPLELISTSLFSPLLSLSLCPSLSPSWCDQIWLTGR